GFRSQTYRGDRLVWHGGGLVGWGARMTLVPDFGIGVAVLTNRSPSEVPTTLTCYIIDRLRKRLICRLSSVLSPPQMLHQLPRIRRQLGKIAHADREIARRPRIRQRHRRDRHGAADPLRRGLRHDADADLAFDQAAHGVEAAQLNAQP